MVSFKIFIKLPLYLVAHFIGYLCRVFVSVRNALIVFALFSLIGAVAVFVTSIILLKGLQKEYEKKMIPFLYVFAFFTLFRIFAFLFFSIVNDNIFAYNVLMCILWVIFSVINVYGWILTYSLYLELEDLTKLEDLAHLRVSLILIINSYKCVYYITNAFNCRWEL